MKEEKGRVGKGGKEGWKKREKRLRERKRAGGAGRGVEREEDWKKKRSIQPGNYIQYPYPRPGYSGSEVRGQNLSGEGSLALESQECEFEF